MKHSFKYLLTLVFALVGSSALLSGANASGQNAYDFTFTPLMGDAPIRLSDYRGKVILVVNTATNCGFASQLRNLQDMYEKYKDQGFIVIGVPSNDFKQEPRNAEQIAEYCKANFGVSFPMTSKQVVIGNNAHPFYIWAQGVFGANGGTPSWNFHKFLIDRSGNLVANFYPPYTPDSKTVVETVEKLLNQP